MVNSIGHKREKLKLEDIIKSNAIGHAYLFVGKKSIGKKIVAIEFAKAIMCDNADDGEPCGHCASCKTFENNSDFKLLLPEKDVIKVDMIRELSREIFMLPTISKRKVFIIDDADSMNEQAQNALLKVLEEPPEYAVIILVTSNENLLLNTIKSRCIKILFSNLSDEEILEYFERNHEDISKTMVSTFGGSIERAINLKDKIEIYEKIKNVFENIEQLNELEVLRLKDDVLNDKDEIFSILDYINTCFYNKMINNISKAEKYNNCIQAVEEAKTRLRRNSNYDMTIDNLLFAIERSITNG